MVFRYGKQPCASLVCNISHRLKPVAIKQDFITTGTLSCFFSECRCYYYYYYYYWGLDSSAGIATRYGLEGPGIESRWGARFSSPVQTGLGAHPASYTMGTGSFLGVKRPGRGVDHQPPSSTKAEGRVELYICFLPGPSWPVLGRTLPLPLPLLLLLLLLLLLNVSRFKPTTVVQVLTR